MERRERWLITGGAGYLGAHIADTFLSDGKDVVILDSLHQGLLTRLDFLSQKHKREIPFLNADIRDLDSFKKALESFNPQGVIHSAALKSVGESVERPDEYMEVNFHATSRILDAVHDCNIQEFIFSSTAAVYGSPDHSNPVGEEHETKPISPYGASKLAAEIEVTNFLNKPGNRGTSLRFFNIVGTANFELIDNSTQNLVPILINKIRSGQPPLIYGTDYPTADGTCIRDYVDVRDVARAHLMAANCDFSLPPVMNVGTGIGSSVKQVIALVESAFGVPDLKIEESQRRIGDSAVLCADVSRIRKVLGFNSQYSLEDSIKSLRN
jgi:UDP-glucose 4-epimerase